LPELLFCEKDAELLVTEPVLEGVDWTTPFVELRVVVALFVVDGVKKTTA